MVMYPHTMIITSLNTDAVQDENGNWTQQDSETTLLLPCRAEPNGNRYIVNTDGSKYVFAFGVYMPGSTPEIPEGSNVTIKDISQQAAGYSPLNKEPIEIVVTPEMAGSSTIAVLALKGKKYLLSKRGFDWYRRSEYSYLSDGGFTLENGYQPEEGEVFFAFETGNDVPDNIDSAKLVATGTVKQFSKGQLNCRLWL